MKMSKLKILNCHTINDFHVSAEAFKNPYQLNPTDDICCVLLLLLQRMMSVSPAAMLVNRQDLKTDHDTEQSCQKLMPVAGIFVLNPCHEKKKIRPYISLQICYGFIVLQCINQLVSPLLLLLNAVSGPHPFIGS